MSPAVLQGCTTGLAPDSDLTRVARCIWKKRRFGKHIQAGPVKHTVIKAAAYAVEEKLCAHSLAKHVSYDRLASLFGACHGVAIKSEPASA